ncbi:hypothetical protein L7F22_023058 [Adiantum nelumboides]|nr:hypothetical protein [Adiantum nelumboides]
MLHHVGMCNASGGLRRPTPPEFKVSLFGSRCHVFVVVATAGQERLSRLEPCQGSLTAQKSGPAAVGEGPFARVKVPDAVQLKSPHTASYSTVNGPLASTPATRTLATFPTQSTPAFPAIGGGSGSGSPSADDSGRFASFRNVAPPSPLANVSYPEEEEGVPDVNVDDDASMSAHVHFAASASASASASQSASVVAGLGDLDEEEEEDVFMLAKSLFDHQQWERCATMLEGHRVKGVKALFLGLYARYLALDKKMEEDRTPAAKRKGEGAKNGARDSRHSSATH